DSPAAVPPEGRAVAEFELAEGMRWKEAVDEIRKNEQVFDGGFLGFAIDGADMPGAMGGTPIGLGRDDGRIVLLERARELKDVEGFRRMRKVLAAETKKRAQLQVLAREYAHRKQPSADGSRHDFAEVLYWHPLLSTDAGGVARFEFDTSDSVTTFAIGVDAHD